VFDSIKVFAKYSTYKLEEIIEL